MLPQLQSRTRGQVNPMNRVEHWHPEIYGIDTRQEERPGPPGPRLRKFVGSLQAYRHQGLAVLISGDKWEFSSSPVVVGWPTYFYITKEPAPATFDPVKYFDGTAGEREFKAMSMTLTSEDPRSNITVKWYVEMIEPGENVVPIRSDLH